MKTIKCANCGAEIEADSNFCIVCGKPVSRTGTTSGTYPASKPAPVFYQPEPAPRKSSSALLISLVVLGVASLLAGAYFLFWDDLFGVKSQTYSIQTEYTYTIKPGEESGMSVRRSQLETMEDLLAKAPGELKLENSLPLAYCLLDVNVGEPQNMRGSSANGEGGKILRTASSIITDNELNARYDYLKSKPEHLARIREAEAALLLKKTELKLAEAQLALASKGADALQDLIGSLQGPELAQPLDSLPLIDNSMDQALRVYDSALGAIEGVYESLNSLKTEVASVQAESKKGGRVP